MHIRLITKRTFVLLLILFSLPLSVAAQENPSTYTLIYKGIEMTQGELQTLKGEIPFYCVQEVTEAANKVGESNIFHCYDTMEELSKKYDEMRPAIDQYFATNQQNSLDAVGHWAVYANVAYSGLISDIYASPCSGLVPDAYIYSLTHWDNPTFSLEVRAGPNYTGAGVTYTYPSNAYWLLTPYRSARPYVVC